MRKVLDIIIPFYKQEDKHLERMIENAHLNKDVNFIFVFNEIELNRAKKIEKTDNIKILIAPNELKKIGKLNFAKDELSGIFVQVMDPDDTLDQAKVDDFLSYSKKMILDVIPQIVINSFQWWDEKQNKVTWTKKLKNTNGFMKKGDIFNTQHFLENAGVIYKREVFIFAVAEAYKHYDEIFAQDVVLGCAAGKVMSENGFDETSILICDIPFYVYCKYNESFTNTYNARTFYNLKNSLVHEYSINAMYNFEDSLFFEFSMKRVLSDLISIYHYNNLTNRCFNEIEINPIFKNFVILENRKIKFICNQSSFEKEFTFPDDDGIWYDSNDKVEGLSICLTLYEETIDETLDILDRIDASLIEDYGRIIVIFDRDIDIDDLLTLRKKKPTVFFYSNFGNFGKTRSALTAALINNFRWIKLVDPDDKLLIRSVAELKEIEEEISSLSIRDHENVILHKILIEKWDAESDLEWRDEISFYDKTGIYEKEIKIQEDVKILPFNGNKIYRTSAIIMISNEMEHITMHEDVLMTSLLARKQRRIIYINKNIYLYNYGIGMTSKSDARLEEQWKVTKTFGEHLINFHPLLLNELIHHNLIHTLVSRDGFSPSEAEKEIRTIIKKNLIEFEFEDNYEIEQYLNERVNFKRRWKREE